MNVIDNINGTWAYTYDGVNRLSTATATGHSFQYTDDAYGNMTCVDNGSLHSPCTPLGLTVSPSNNRITTSNYSYDNNGNLLTTNALMRAMVYDTGGRGTDTYFPISQSVTSRPVTCVGQSRFNVRAGRFSRSARKSGNEVSVPLRCFLPTSFHLCI
jgi:uncharacterized protein RhaS with RHS repeats